MTAPADKLALGIFERTEAMLGRSDWTWSDYIAEGRREYLANGGRHDPAGYAWSFAYFNCPPSKRPGGDVTLAAKPAVRRAA